MTSFWIILIFIFLINAHRQKYRELLADEIKKWDGQNTFQIAHSLESLLKWTPFRKDIYIELVKLYYYLGYFEKVKKILVKIHINPGDSLLLFYKGQIHQTEEMWELSIQCFQSIKEYQTQSPILVSLGLSYLKIGDLQKSEDFLFQALALSPENPYIYFYLGQVFWAKGEKVQSFKFFDMIAQLDNTYINPEFLETVNNLVSELKLLDHKNE